MGKEQINARQLFILVLFFELGSALVVGLGGGAKQDAWLAVLVAMIGGIILFLIYHRLYQYYPDIPLTEYLELILGKILGRFIALLYILYFLYISSRVLRDFGEFLGAIAYMETPTLFINTLMIVTIAYAVYKGFEVIARTGELFFVLLYLLAISGFILISVAGLIDVKNVKPILEQGWKPVFREVFTSTLYFPFGEMVVFLMLLPHLNKPKKAKRTVIFAMLLSGINLAITMAVNVAVLGPDTFDRSTFPLLATIQKIRVANFLERLDVFFMITLVLGGYFKISLFFYSALIGTARLFHIEDYRKLIYPLGLVTLLLSLTIASNYTEHIKEGVEIVTVYLHLPLQVIVPTSLLVIASVRSRRQKKLQSSTT